MKKITEIKENKKNQNRVSLYGDGDFLFACEKELIYKHQIKKGDAIDEKTLQQIIFEDDYIKAREISLRQLERSFKTEKQIKDKLLEKEFSEEIIEKVILKLREYHLVDDEKYAQLFLNEKLRTRGLKKANYELSQKGIPREIIEQVSSSMDTQSMEEDSCLVHGQKKYDQLKRREKDPYKLKNKLYTFLSSKGYDYDVITHTLQEVIPHED